MKEWLTRLEELPLKTFEFQTVTVNRKGEIVNRQQHQAQFFTEDLGDGVILEMVAIPGGTFIMGSPAGEGNDSEKPQHRVSVQPFALGKYPVTQAQWQAVMGNNRSRFKGANRPVKCVSWRRAMEFCRTLSQRTGREYRLPSEAEWEYACRAGTTTPFYFGETITAQLANYKAKHTYADAPIGKYRKQTTDVGSFPPNAFGVYDLHGNVWEWCWDNWHDNYHGAPTDGRAWLNNNLYQQNSSKVTANDKSRVSDALTLDLTNASNSQLIKVLRGGSWIDLPGYCRSADRTGLNPDCYGSNLGFRVVCGSGRTLP
jgi:formylglycine-generating enzyme required for sulfatase activity